MAEFQNNQQTSGEMTRRFIEFILMQAQQVVLMLGQMPGPDGKHMVPNLPVAKIFIDQLDMIREKTRGNLSTEESELLTKVLSDLQIAYVDADRKESVTDPTVADKAAETEKISEPDVSTTAESEESKKKFTKTYE